MMKDYFFKREFRNDTNFVNEKIIGDISMLDNLYDNNIKLNENLKSSKTSNNPQLPNEDLGSNLKSTESYQPTNTATKCNLDGIQPNLQAKQHYSNIQKDVTMNDIMNGSMSRNDGFNNYGLVNYGLEEKATNTDDLTSSKIDDLLAVNEQFMKCKEQFILNCVRNQPDLIAKIFPDLFKKNKVYKPNLISIKRKRDNVIVKSNQTSSKGLTYEKKTKDKDGREVRFNERNEDSESMLSVVTSTKNGAVGSNLNLGNNLGSNLSSQGAVGINMGHMSQHSSKGTTAERKLKEKIHDKRFSSYKKETENEEQLSQQSHRDNQHSHNHSNKIDDKRFNPYSSLNTNIKKKNISNISESSPQSNFQTAIDPKETNFLSTNLSEMCEVFNLPILNKQKKTNIEGIQNLQNLQAIQGIQGLQNLQGIQSLQGIQGIQGIQNLKDLKDIDGNNVNLVSMNLDDAQKNKIAYSKIFGIKNDVNERLKEIHSNINIANTGTNSANQNSSNYSNPNQSGPHSNINNNNNINSSFNTTTNTNTDTCTSIGSAAKAKVTIITNNQNYFGRNSNGGNASNAAPTSNTNINNNNLNLNTNIKNTNPNQNTQSTSSQSPRQNDKSKETNNNINPSPSNPSPSTSTNPNTIPSPVKNKETKEPPIIIPNIKENDIKDIAPPVNPNPNSNPLTSTAISTSNQANKNNKSPTASNNSLYPPNPNKAEPYWIFKKEFIEQHSNLNSFEMEKQARSEWGLLEKETKKIYNLLADNERKIQKKKRKKLNELNKSIKNETENNLNLSLSAVKNENENEGEKGEKDKNE